jgi:o-succinylbenzoate synthase
VQLSVIEERHALRDPLPTAHGTITIRDCLVVTATAAGHSGSGEAAPLPGFGLETHTEARSQLRAWSTSGRQPTTPAAAAAVACAYDQLEAARHGTTLDGLLGGHAPITSPLAVQALVGSPDPGTVARMTAAAVADGHRAVKLKVAAADPARDIERVTAAAETLAGAALLRLDANQGWSLGRAEQVLSAVAHLGIDLVEEPTATLADFAPLGAAVGLDIAADEHLVDAAAAERIVEDRLSAALVLKPAVLGGPRSTHLLAQRARAAGLRCIVSSFIDGPVGLRAARDLALAVDPHGVHGVGTAGLFTDPFPADVVARGGSLHR